MCVELPCVCTIGQEMERSKQQHQQKKDDMSQTHTLELQVLQHNQKLHIQELNTRAQHGKQ